MRLSRKDRQILRHMADYCAQVQEAVVLFGSGEDVFLKSAVYRNACAMPIMQIGELAGKFSDEFLAADAEIPWKAVRGMRNLFAHDYGSMDLHIIWMTVSKNIPELAAHINILLHESPEHLNRP